jgi:hypothetical protein
VKHPPSASDPVEPDLRLDAAFRRRREQFGTRAQPADAASGTARIAARLAEARVAARRTPPSRTGAGPDEVIDLT